MPGSARISAMMVSNSMTALIFRPCRYFQRGSAAGVGNFSGDGAGEGNAAVRAAMRCHLTNDRFREDRPLPPIVGTGEK